MQGHPIKNWRAGGTPNLGGWLLGERITNISQVKVGDILLQDSVQFDALNLCRVNEFPGFPESIIGSRLYAVFVDPTDTAKLRVPSDAPFCVWDHDFESPSGVYYHVSKVPPADEAPLQLSPSVMDRLQADELLVGANELIGYAASAAVKELMESWSDAVHDGVSLEHLVGDIDNVTAKLEAFKARALAAARNTIAS